MAAFASLGFCGCRLVAPGVLASCRSVLAACGGATWQVVARGRRFACAAAWQAIAAIPVSRRRLPVASCAAAHIMRPTAAARLTVRRDGVTPLLLLPLVVAPLVVILLEPRPVLVLLSVLLAVLVLTSTLPFLLLRLPRPDVVDGGGGGGVDPSLPSRPLRRWPPARLHSLVMWRLVTGGCRCPPPSWTSLARCVRLWSLFMDFWSGWSLPRCLVSPLVPRERSPE